MTQNEKLSEKEFGDMLNALKRHIETDMDQWELWKFDTSRGTIHINISLAPEGPENMYIDLNHLISGK